MVTPVDTLFLFLAPGIGPAEHRVERRTAAGRAAFVWVPDADAAAGVAGGQAEVGVRLVELYRGFGLADAGRVVTAVAGRAPVGLAARTGRATGNSVTIFGDDTGAEPLVVEHGATSTTVVAVADEEAAVRAAEEAVAAGADTVEVCGGTPLTAAARVEDAVAGRAAVTLVGWPFESLEGAAAYKAAYAAGH